MKIHEIQKVISDLFSKHKIPVITHKMEMTDLHRWSSEVAAHFKLNEDELSQAMSELFWSAAHIQLSLGYAVIARQDCEFPKGKSGKAFKVEEMPGAMGLPEIHFWYHIYNSYECIYRSWERMAFVLKFVCYPKNNEKMYFDQIVKALEKDDNYNKNPRLNLLKKQIKHWNKAAGARNEISHGKSSPFRNMKVKGNVSNIFATNGFPQIYLNYSISSPKKSIEEVVDKYKKVFPAMEVAVAFIDNIGK